jgi:hypothetical protein
MATLTLSDTKRSAMLSFLGITGKGMSNADLEYAYWKAVVSGGGGGGGITHGSQITESNTGIEAMGLVVSDLETVSGTHFLTDFTGGSGGSAGNPKIVEGYNFTGDVLFDQSHITLRGCNLANPTTAFTSGTHKVGVKLEYCTISPATVGAECMHFQSWSAFRCKFMGCSDGARIDGGADIQEIVECYIRTTMATANDHNDGLQNVGGSGTVNVRRCNISTVPTTLITGGSGGPNAAIMSADMTAGSVYSLNVEDCYLDGTGAVETLRFYDGGLTPNIQYRAVGNIFKDSASAPVGKGVSNTTPSAQIKWYGNKWASGAFIARP